LARIPAICNNCGRLFPTGFAVEGQGVAQIINCAAGPCPYCGSMGKIPDGIYSALTNTAHLLASGAILAPHLIQLISILNSSTVKKADSESVSSQIKENLPELSSIADYFPKTRAELYAFMAILIALATLILNTCKSETSSPSVLNSNINLIVNQAIELSYKETDVQQDIGAIKIKKKTAYDMDSKKSKILKKKKIKIAKQSKRKNRRK